MTDSPDPFDNMPRKPAAAPGAVRPPRRFVQTRTARMARARLARHLHGFGDDEGLWWRVQELVPQAWATVEDDIDCEEEKVKITLRLDASVVKLFRAMGRGYQARIGHILATYARMRMGEVEKEAQGMRALMTEYGVVQSEELHETYHRLREHVGLFDPETRAKMDAAFGIKEG